MRFDLFLYGSIEICWSSIYMYAVRFIFVRLDWYLLKFDVYVGGSIYFCTVRFIFVMQPRISGTICPVKWFTLTHSEVFSAFLRLKIVGLGKTRDGQHPRRSKCNNRHGSVTWPLRQANLLVIGRQSKENKNWELIRKKNVKGLPCCENRKPFGHRLSSAMAHFCHFFTLGK